MSTATQDLSSSASVLEGMLSIPLPLPLSDISLQITIPDFQVRLAAPLVEVSTAFEDGEVVIKAAVGPDVIAVLNLTGRMVKGSFNFQTERFSFSLKLAKQRARPLFVASSIMSMLGLAGEMEIQIPELEIGQGVSFDLPLPKICERLEKRQIAYRLMVIERATNRKFFLPTSFSASDMGAIAFTYHAIVDRSFVWPNTDTFEGSVQATLKGRSMLPPPGETTLARFPRIPCTRKILGQEIPLGHANIVFEDAIIQHPDEVYREIADGDGHQVKYVMRSLNGQARYELPEAPRLPDNPWSSDIQTLIDLESKLDARLIERYHALAAATLADLTEEQKAEITRRPELSADAFLIDEGQD